jgi:hypothetical protein
MKSRILSLITLVLVSLGLTNSINAAPKNNMVVTVLNDIHNINKIEVYGNVELYVSDATTDQVKVYNQYYGESALVQNKNGVLRITSYKAEKLVVWVSAADLRSISAFDNAEVKSFGDLSKIELNVDLHNSATATLNLDAYSANVTLADHAKANLTGTVNEYSLNQGMDATVNNNNFTATHNNEVKKSVIAQIKNDDLIGL